MSSLQHVNPTVKGIRESAHSGLQSLTAHVTQEIAQVLAVCLHPELLGNKTLPLDVRLRAQRLLEVCDGGSVGSYTDSSGMPHVRQSIAEFIMRRDVGVHSHAEDVFISAGSQRGLMVILKLLASGEGDTQTGVLTPRPCRHTLPTLLDDAGVALVPYQLMEDRGWLSCAGLEINRGTAERLLLLVDEVYQDSVYGQGKEFISFKRVLFEMGKEYSGTVQMVSLHSLSSACMGECGLRAGYMELVNMDPEVTHLFISMLCTDISSPVTGQLALDLMVNPPRPGDPSYDTYTQEILHIQATLSQNAQRAHEFLNDLPGMSSQPAKGGIYLYPRLHLPSEIIEKAKKLEVEAGVLYCQMLLKEEGVFLGAGCQNGETTGNHYLRLCILVPADTLEEVLARLASFHLRLMDTCP
ncbi:hypothetical protein F7725_028052 [Dissostichus mawsoni]|uniref:alanine transaminase n=1 Tax=Dissostichus mawsoni TaxID=36200 RepID=A0A7J5XET3_DISMA|nr:hypothetical protein F7725_028052 [Dissostichus mawsoni]